MSAQALSARKVRRLARATGLDIVAGWSHGGYVFQFATEDHRHGWFDIKTASWGLYGLSEDRCYTSCRRRWPSEDQIAQTT